MKRLLMPMVLMCSLTAWTQQPNAADYPITVHVASSTMEVTGAAGTKFSGLVEMLWVEMSGKKYELEGYPPKFTLTRPGLIAPGDYRAKLKDDRHKGSYLTYQEYEILFPDGSTGTFALAGESE